MDGIILFNKEKGMTSRDVVNMICQALNTKKVGHTGTLDPIASGLLIVCVGEGCKLVEMLTHKDKDYVAKVKVGIKTDTYDITGKTVMQSDDYSLDKEELIGVLKSFNGQYLQTVPIYSSIKVNGKKLYEYARTGEKVALPKHLVKISNIELINFKDDEFTFKVTVSSGTYIRSLINDIGEKIGVPMTMESLVRTRVGNYYLKDAATINDLKIIPLVESLDIKKIEVDDNLFKKVSNGVKIPNIYHEEMIMFTKNKVPIAIYKNENELLKSYRVFVFNKVSK